MTGPTPAELRERRRAVVKLHHPDRGGDPARLIEALAALDEPAGGVTRPERRAHPFVGVRRRARGRARALRTRLPRRLPGARRYATY